ncbi:Cystathionine gamma-synthase [Hirsutella minnesotensis 3608]|uniref:cystathionine gamma-synthase n=1 Tax=Hirsutella minnesotensis 3608 TaxID=1043627 RepID=A0A0F7ZG75_9HYPO|nr:Cystathionine gamma-synthase [Hirsutella minnesotensis 3608]
MPSFALGEPIPPDTAHAVSVSLPTWKSNVGYEEGQEWVVNRMVTGYPRFFIHKSVDSLAREIVAVYGQVGHHSMLFPTPGAAARCLDFIKQRSPIDASTHLGSVHLVLDTTKPSSQLLRQLRPRLSAVLFPQQSYAVAKQYWQHTGDGISSRRAEFCLGLLSDGMLVPSSGPQAGLETQTRPTRGPRRYQRQASLDTSLPNTTKLVGPGSTDDSRESGKFLEERFGRNLDLALVERAKSAIRRRIAGSLTQEVDLTHELPTPDVGSNTRGLQSLEEHDVYLFPAGMNAIFHAHRALLAARGQLKSISFGFPYVDSLKILEKFGPGCIFYGNGSSEDLDDLEEVLRSGERFLGFFCEFPGNPLLSCPDLNRIKKLADEYDFAVVVDETIGTFANINVLPVADVVVSSLTKIFSGDSNVMGGSAIINPESRYYDSLKKTMNQGIYEDAYWAEDIIVMERNSRDFAARIERINTNAETICEVLRKSSLIKNLFYPKFNASKSHYDAHRLSGGGYGGLLSIVFNFRAQAEAFYDAVDIAKGPSLGTNFTLCSPYVLLAHYQELQWAAQYGVDADLVRISVGLENTEALRVAIQAALQAAGAVGHSSDVSVSDDQR